MPAMTLSRVDLPAPLLPITATNSPSEIVRIDALEGKALVGSAGVKCLLDVLQLGAWDGFTSLHSLGRESSPRACDNVANWSLSAGSGEGQEHEDRRDDLEIGGRKAASKGDQGSPSGRRSEPKTTAMKSVRIPLGRKSTSPIMTDARPEMIMPIPIPASA